MADDLGSNPENSDNKDKGAEDARKKELDSIFGDDLDDLEEEIVQTPEEIKAERDALKEELTKLKISHADTVGRLMREKQGLTSQLTEQKTDSALAQQRIQRAAEDQKAFALEGFVKELLPFVDNLERGLAAIPAADRTADPKFDKLAQGIEKSLVQLTAIFNKAGVKVINPKGEAFDSDRHEAISMQSDPKAEPDSVLEVVQKGYELNGRVIRHAKVVVNPS